MAAQEMRPSGKANARISYFQDLPRGSLEGSISAEWVTGLYMNNYHRDPVQDVFFMDGELRLRQLCRGTVVLEPYCIVRNLLNAEYEYIKGLPMPGINILAGFTLRV